MIVLILAGCAEEPSPEETAIAYGRALYANDADALWRLISETDRRHKDEATFRRQQHQLKGFTREAVEFRLPDANAPAIRDLMHDSDEDRLNELLAASARTSASGSTPSPASIACQQSRATRGSSSSARPGGGTFS